MKSIELLAPAGEPKAFAAAVAAGADAIYCGFGNDFNARRSADNFDAHSFEVACKNAHLAGVSVYVAINIVIKQQEMPQALDLIRQASSLGADAFIIQDWGLFLAVRSIWPDVECHISTQANIHDARGVAFCRDLGAQRVTLSRELSLEEIQIISKENCDLEVFGHGALCFCYSGLCLLSSLLGDKSANRGLCTQPCRLEYDLVDERDTVLSKKGRIKPMCPKDNCTYDITDEIIKSGVASLKIEGRMKQPDYVFSVVDAYRKKIDGCFDNTTKSQLYRAFNRGFTKSYFSGKSNDDMMSYNKSNNKGEFIGVVVDSKQLPSIKVNRGGKNGGRSRIRELTQAQTFVKLESGVGKGDILEITPVDNPTLFLTGRVDEDAHAGDTICVITSRCMPPQSKVRLVRSQASIDLCQREISKQYPRLRDVNVTIKALLNKPFIVEIETCDGQFKVVEKGFVVEAARTRSVTEKDLVDHVGRMGSTPFNPVEFSVELDSNCGMSFSQVHKVRANACDRLQTLIEEAYKVVLPQAPSVSDLHNMAHDYSKLNCDKKQDITLCALVPNSDMSAVALSAGVDEVYVRNDDYSLDGFGESARIVLDEVCRQQDHERIDLCITNNKVVVSCISELAKALDSGSDFEISPTIPVHNEFAVSFMEHMGAGAIWLSPELTISEIETLCNFSNVDMGVVVSGHNRVMTSEHCILQVAGKCIGDCAKCTLRNQKLYLRKPDGLKLPVMTTLEGRSRLYSPYTTDLVPYVSMLKKAGITKFMIDASLMDTSEFLDCVKRFKTVIKSDDSHCVLPISNSTTVHLNLGIE